MERINPTTVMKSKFIDLPQLVAGHDVEKRHGEEDCGVCEHQDILHARNSLKRILAAKPM
jgi:hypothetical protein